MDVPIEYKHAFQSVLSDRGLCGRRDVVEQAEPHRPRALGVVSGRSQAAEANRFLTAQQPVDHQAGPSRSMKRSAEGRLADERVLIDRPPAGRGKLTDHLDVPPAVDLLERGVGHDGRVEDVKSQPVERSHFLFDRDNPLRSVGMLKQLLGGIVRKGREVTNIDAHRPDRVRTPGRESSS